MRTRSIPGILANHVAPFEARATAVFTRTNTCWHICLANHVIRIGAKSYGSTCIIFVLVLVSLLGQSCRSFTTTFHTAMFLLTLGLI